MSRKLFSLFVGFAFLIVAFFGVHFTMQMNSDGMMQNCPFLGHVKSVCPMSVSEHVVKWKQFFTATIPSSNFLFAAFLMIIFVFVPFVFRPFSFDVLRFQAVSSRGDPPEYSSGFLLRAFGRGILRKRE